MYTKLSNPFLHSVLEARRLADSHGFIIESLLSELLFPVLYSDLQYTLSVPLQVDRLVKTPALLRRKAIKALVSRVH